MPRRPSSTHKDKGEGRSGGPVWSHPETSSPVASSPVAEPAIEQDSGSEVDEDAAIRRLIQMRRDDRMAIDEYEEGHDSEDEDADMSYSFHGDAFGAASAHMHDDDDEEDEDDEEVSDGEDMSDDGYGRKHRRGHHGSSSRQEDEDEEDEDEDDEDEDDEHDHDHDSAESDEGNFFASWHRRRAGGGVGSSSGAAGGLFDTLSSGLMMSGFSMRIRPILASLKDHSDPSAVMMGLQELAENLLVSTEDLLIGFFPSDQTAQELMSIMRDPIFEDSPEILLLACRDLYNLMEALPSSVSHVVNAGAIPVLCQKLLEINYIDLAEQALSTLERISEDYPSDVVSEGGLNACLMYLDFFSTHVQRTALSVASNCCQDIPKEMFYQVVEIMPILQNCIDNDDQKVAEKACTCVCEIAESFADERTNLEEIMSDSLLAKLLELLSSSAFSSAIRHRILKVVALAAKASSKLSVALIDANVGGLLFQLLTSHKPDDTGVDVIQQLIHADKGYLLTSISIITDIFPPVDLPAGWRYSGPYVHAVFSDEKKQAAEERCSRLKSDAQQVGVFAHTAASLLLDMYNASLDVSMRQKVIQALLRIVTALDSETLATALEKTELSSVISGMLSQRDLPSLVVGALEIGEAVLAKLPDIYGPRFYRLGIIDEITAMAEPGVSQDDNDNSAGNDQEADDSTTTADDATHLEYVDFESPALEQVIVADSARLLDLYRSSSASASHEEEAAAVKQRLQDIKDMFDKREADLTAAFAELAGVLPLVSGFELVRADLLVSFADVMIAALRGDEAWKAQFFRVFVQENLYAFALLVSKLHQALSRSERFEIINTNTRDSRSAPASALARQMRVRLVADEDSDFPRSLRNIIISIQAIATFKIVEEFLKSKIAVGRLFARSTTASRLQNAWASLGFGGAGAAAAANNETESRAGAEADTENKSHDNDQDHDNDHDHDPDDKEMTDDGPAEDIHDDESDTVQERMDMTPQKPRSTQADEDDYHLEFYLNGEPVPLDGTVFGAIYRFSESDGDQQQQQQQTQTSRTHHMRNIWANTYTIEVRKVPGAATPKKDEVVLEAENLDPLEAIPSSFGNDPLAALTIRLLTVLYLLNQEAALHPPGARLPASKFINSKLTAKLNKQLDEPLVVASGILPPWIVDATRLYPFLFPFESRYTFLQSTSFGYSRSMFRWQGQANADGRDETRHPMGRLIRQKVRVSRNHILHSAVKVMELCGASPNILEVEFFDEVGTGLGPTLEFYSAVSKEFALKQYKMWRESGSSAESAYVDDPRGLFPGPVRATKLESANGKKVLQLFKTLGTFVARSLLDTRIIDINFNPVFFALASGRPQDAAVSLATLGRVDPQLASSLRALLSGTVNGVAVDDLALDFTLPGDASVELVPDGADRPVTASNVGEYVDAVTAFVLRDGIAAQLDAFRSGFSEVFPFSALQAFYPEELSSLLGQADEDWSYQTIFDAIKADHGFTKESQTVKDLVEILSTFSRDEQRAFLQFMTGSPKLPPGGFKALHPVFTVVWKQTDEGSGHYGRDAYLPSVMTCANYLKVPNYSSRDILRERLLTAVYEGSGAFHLS